MSRSRTAKLISGPELPHDIIVGEFAAESSPLKILDEARVDDGEAGFPDQDADRQDGQFLPDRREMTDGITVGNRDLDICQRYARSNGDRRGRRSFICRLSEMPNRVIRENSPEIKYRSNE